MPFNFHESFKAFSNDELLQILLKGENYQPEAVDAARAILEARGLQPEDLNVQIHAATQLAASSEGDSSSVSELLEPYILPNRYPHSEQWLQILLAILLLLFGWSVLDAITNISAFRSSGYGHYPVALILKIFDAVVAAITIWLLWRRHRWGWIIQFANCLFVLFSVLYTIYTALLFSFRSDWVAQGLKIIINGGTCLFLWHPAIAALLHITPAIKKKTTLTVTAVSLALFFILRLTN